MPGLRLRLPLRPRLRLAMLLATFLGALTASGCASTPRLDPTVLHAASRYMEYPEVWADADALLVIQSNGSILTSTDGGRTFTRSKPPTMKAYPPAHDAVLCNSVLLADSGADLWLSRDAGKTWQKAPVTSLLRDYERINSLGCDGKTLVAVGIGGLLLRSTDRGASWSRRGSATSTTLESVALAGGTIVAAGDGRVITRSTDGGASFQAQVLDPGNSFGDPIASLELFPDGHAFALVGNVLFRSSDGGATWSHAPLAVGPSSAFVTLAAATPTDLLLTSTEDGHSFRSTDGGTTWSAGDDLGGFFSAVARPAGGYFAVSSLGILAIP
jgi:photosystem II stability/assembly factor-like uncharacterized protein